MKCKIQKTRLYSAYRRYFKIITTFYRHSNIIKSLVADHQRKYMLYVIMYSENRTHNIVVCVWPVGVAFASVVKFENRPPRPTKVVKLADIYAVIVYGVSVFIFWRERVVGTIFIGLDRVENVRETAPSEKQIRILISTSNPLRVHRAYIKRPDLFFVRSYRNP